MTLDALTLASTLQTAGRHPALPFRVALADGRPLDMHRLLRVLPGKRLVGEAELEGRRVLAKLFVGRRSEKHWRQERAGLEAPRSGRRADARTLLVAMADGRRWLRLLTDFLEPAESLAEAGHGVAGRAAGRRRSAGVLAPALTHARAPARRRPGAGRPASRQFSAS
jgi:hypothetical protein